MPNADELLNQTLELFENDITKADQEVALTNVLNWIEFLRADGSGAAMKIADLLEPLADFIQNLNVPRIKDSCEQLQPPTEAAGDPKAPSTSRPGKISRLGRILGAWM